MISAAWPLLDGPTSLPPPAVTVTHERAIACRLSSRAMEAIDRDPELAHRRSRQRHHLPTSSPQSRAWTHSTSRRAAMAQSRSPMKRQRLPSTRWRSRRACLVARPDLCDPLRRAGETGRHALRLSARSITRGALIRRRRLHVTQGHLDGKLKTIINDLDHSSRLERDIAARRTDAQQLSALGGLLCRASQPLHRSISSSRTAASIGAPSSSATVRIPPLF